MVRFADKLYFDKQKIDGVESAVLLTIIVGGLALCVLGAAIYDIGRGLSVWYTTSELASVPGGLFLFCAVVFARGGRSPDLRATWEAVSGANLNQRRD